MKPSRPAPTAALDSDDAATLAAEGLLVETPMPMSSRCKSTVECDGVRDALPSVGVSGLEGE